jgi:hypothetical protein
MGLFREFLLILTGAATGAVLGTAFGAAVGALSPEFIDLLTQPHSAEHPVGVAAAMGMVLGVLIGAAAMAVGRLIGAVYVLGSSLRGVNLGRIEPNPATARRV